MKENLEHRDGTKQKGYPTKDLKADAPRVSSRSAVGQR